MDFFREMSGIFSVYEPCLKKRGHPVLAEGQSTHNYRLNLCWRVKSQYEPLPIHLAIFDTFGEEDTCIFFKGKE